MIENPRVGSLAVLDLADGALLQWPAVTGSPARALRLRTAAAHPWAARSRFVSLSHLEREAGEDGAARAFANPTALF
jgi:hypothetical protein